MAGRPAISLVNKSEQDKMLHVMDIWPQGMLHCAVWMGILMLKEIEKCNADNSPDLMIQHLIVKANVKLIIIMLQQQLMGYFM